MADQRNMWLAHFSLNDETHHLMILHNDAGQSKVEEAFNALAKAHKDVHPNITMKLEKLERIECPEQVDREKARLKAKYPKQMFADELFPDNPNALLFKPMRATDAEIASGRADEALIRHLCDGFMH